MESTDLKVCKELFLDLLCYEIHRGTISPEMKGLFEDHLVKCRYCRSKALGLFDLLSLNSGSSDTTIN